MEPVTVCVPLAVELNVANWEGELLDAWVFEALRDCDNEGSCACDDEIEELAVRLWLLEVV